MLKRKYDFNKALRCVRYGRMSSERQNPCSPDHQFAEIARTVRLQNRPWVMLKDYRDDAVKGSYIRRRPGLQAMLSDIRAGRLKVDAILVDTLERLGRSDEIPAIRQRLLTRSGVLVLTADSAFADPTTQAGKALGFVENVRATAANEVKAHDVFRGKRAVALNRRWPGGPPPFGYRLAKRVVPGAAGNDEVYSDLELDPVKGPVLREMLRLATTGMGQADIARTLNADARVPEHLKPIHADTVGYVLDNPICCGTLRWNLNCTGVVDDTRKVQRNPAGEVEFVEDFCEPVISKSDYERYIAGPRRARREVLANQRLAAAAADAVARGEDPSELDKQIRPLAAGLALKYLLSGLVRCADCGARMVAAGSGGDEAKYGKRYVYYRCPRFVSGACDNKTYLREDRLRDAVVDRIRYRLLPPPGAASSDDPASDGNRLVPAPGWLPELVDEIRREAAALAALTPDRRSAIARESSELRARIDGWELTLGSRDLPTLQRQSLVQRCGEAYRRVEELQREVAQLEDHDDRLDRAVDVRQALDRLRRLSDVLAAGHVPAGNFELSLHVDAIEVDAGGRVVMRTCKLGAFAGAVELIARGNRTGLPPTPVAGATSPATANQVDAPPVAGSYAAPAASADPTPARRRVRPRRRGRLQLDGTEQEAVAREGGQEVVADPSRFEGVDRRWFWADPLELERTMGWAERNAPEVGALRRADPRRWTHERLAARFGRSIPTIRKALKFAAAAAAVPDADRAPAVLTPPGAASMAAQDVSRPDTDAA